MTVPADFKRERPSWCPGCGNFAVLAALQRAASRLGLDPDHIVLVTGIGCSGKLSSFFRSYGFHGVHGRTLPVAAGVKLADRELTVVAAGGDGDGYGIGLSHFIHAARRNVDITYIVMDNHIYGLTTGQTSPTSPRGFRSKTSPAGAVEEPVRPLELAISAGAGFVAQGLAGNVKQLAELFERAIQHRGFSFINVRTPCVTFNPKEGYDALRLTSSDGAGEEEYDRSSRLAALKHVMGHPGLPTGVIFEEEGTSYDQALLGDVEPLAWQDLTLGRGQLEALGREFQ